MTYFWRSLTEEQRTEALRYRKLRRFPKHSPPHFDSEIETTYILTAACFEHKPVMGKSIGRISAFENEVVEIFGKFCSNVFAWCILPNHYHFLIRTGEMAGLRAEVGRLHGRTSFAWNGEDDSRGRQVWHNCFERKIRSERHFFASLNYVLNNAVHHRYVKRWTDWQWSNADDYLEKVGRDRAEEIWKSYPILDYGSKWDIY
jgi:putative transposase